MDVRLSDVIAPAFYDVHRQIAAGNVGEALCKGGRGGAKSSFISVEILLLLLRWPTAHAVVLRKVGKTLRNSVYNQMRWAIGALGMEAYFRCLLSPMEITYLPTGQKIFFFGLDDADKLKGIKVSFGYVGALWFEELDQFDGEAEIRKAEQSVLRGGDRFMVFKSFNPPAGARQWANAYAREAKPGRLVHHSTYLQTPRAWLGERFFADAEHLRQTSETAYRNEYLGEVVGSGTAVFENIRPRKVSEAEIAQYARVYRGVDWGYYPDPWAYNEMHFDPARGELTIFGELTARRLGNEATAALIRARGRSEPITADSAEPKSIGDYKACGLPCVAARKGPGSVEHGMKWLQSLRAIVIDPERCPDTLREFSEYEYERAKDGSVIDGYPDASNHHIDAVRYAMEQVSARRVAVARRR